MNDQSEVQTTVIFRSSSRGHKSRHFNRTPSQRHEEKRPITGRYGPNLQVQGFGCPLLYRPGSGQLPPQQPSPKPDQPSTTSLLLLTTIKNKLESRVLPALRPRAGTKSGLSKITTPCVSNISPTEMAPMNPCKSQVQIGSSLHLYLPSSKCEEEEDDDTQDIRTRAEQSDPQESKVKANSPDPTPLPNSSCISEDQAIPRPSTTSPSTPHPHDITLDVGPPDLRQPQSDQ